MKKHYESGNIVPITTGNVKSSWIASPDPQRERTQNLYPIMRVGALELQKQTQQAHEAMRQKRMQAVLDLLSHWGD